MRNSILVLTKNYEPLTRISVEKAFCLLYTGRATKYHFNNPELNNYVCLRSLKETYYLPKMIILNSSFQVNQWINSKPLYPTRRMILTRDEGKCVYCGKKATTLDHVTPVSKGGKNTWKNMVSACHPCNNKKGDKTIEEIGYNLKQNPRNLTAYDLLLPVNQEFHSILDQESKYA